MPHRQRFLAILIASFLLATAVIPLHAFAGQRTFAAAHPALPAGTGPAAPSPDTTLVFSEHDGTLEFAGQFGGEVRGLAARGTLLYAGIGPRLVVFDTTNPDSPTRVWESEWLGDAVWDLALGEQHAYVAAGATGLYTFDISVPAQPVKTALMPPHYADPNSEAFITAVTINEGRGFFLDSHWGLHELILTDPAQPSTGSGTREGTVFTNGRLATSGDYVYLFQNLSLITYYTTSIHTPPAYQSERQGGSFVLAGAYAYVGNSEGLHVLDMSNPGFPSMIATVPGAIGAIAIAGQYLYAASAEGMAVYDITTPASPQVIGSVASSPTNALVDAAIAGNTLFFASERLGIRAFDVSDPARPAERATYTWAHQVYSMALQRTKAYIGTESGVGILDITNTNSIAVLGTYPQEGYAHAVAIAGNELHAGVGQSYIVRDVANASSPQLVGSLNINDSALHIALAGDHAFLRPTTGTSILILDLTDKTRPTQAGVYLGNGALHDFLASGTHLYRLGFGANGLRVLDISQPATPQDIAVLALPGEPRNVALVGNHLLIAAGTAGLRVIDVTDPANPVEAGSYTGTGEITHVAADGGAAWVYDTLQGLVALDISVPAQPRAVASRWVPRTFEQMAAQGSQVFLASRTTGLTIFQWPDSAGSLPAAPVAGATPAPAASPVPTEPPGATATPDTLPAETPEVAPPPAAAATPVPVPGEPPAAPTPPPLPPFLPPTPTPHQGPFPPTPGMSVQPVTLRWTAPAGTAQYHLRVLPFNGDGPGINLIIGDPALVAAQEFTIIAPLIGQGLYVLLPGMSYGWQVRTTTKATPAAEDDPAWGPWSEPLGFRTAPPSSAGILPVAPLNAAQLGSSGAATLRWSNADLTVFYYEVEVSADPHFATDPAAATSAVWWNLVHGGAAVPPNSWQTPELAGGTTYYWRVRPRVQGDGAPVAWSPTWSFRTP